MRYAKNAARVNNRIELCEKLAKILKTRDSQQWLDDLEAVSVPCGPINTIDQVFENPQVRARGLRIEVEHPLAKHAPLVGNPIKYSKTPLQNPKAPPLLGANLKEVLSELLNYSDDEIAYFKEQGIV